MTYTPPELLLVGAAQNLVLGDSHVPVEPCIPLPDPSTQTYLPDLNWQSLILDTIIRTDDGGAF